jgi:hypothetical protein
MVTNRKDISLLATLVVLVAALTLNCKPPKAESDSSGSYSGTATNKANSADIKPISLTITSVGNPVSGAYKLGSTSGQLSGSALGLILNLTFKPNGPGTTYTFDGISDNNNTTISGTMTGVESGTTVHYNVSAKK